MGLLAVTHTGSLATTALRAPFLATASKIAQARLPVRLNAIFEHPFRRAGLTGDNIRSKATLITAAFNLTAASAANARCGICDKLIAPQEQTCENPADDALARGTRLHAHGASPLDNHKGGCFPSKSRAPAIR